MKGAVCLGEVGEEESGAGDAVSGISPNECALEGRLRCSSDRAIHVGLGQNRMTMSMPGGREEGFQGSRGGEGVGARGEEGVGARGY